MSTGETSEERHLGRPVATRALVATILLAAAVLVIAYFTGMLANALPLPGGIGGVEGGMIGALVGFGVPGSRTRGGPHLPRLFVLAADPPRCDRLPATTSHGPLGGEASSRLAHPNGPRFVEGS